MQTRFSIAQLADPDLAESNRILRSCVHCGMCTATCPTFVLLGDELDSPRGRIYLIKEMLEQGGSPPASTVRHIDRCLSCLSCMTTCPSGVHYMHLVDHARTYIERHFRRPPAERLMRQLFSAILPYPRRFRLALRAARLVRPLAALLPSTPSLFGRLRAALRLSPVRLPPPALLVRPQRFPPQGERRGRVALLTGCAQQVLAPTINEATIRLLTQLGFEVVISKGQGCCGALDHHLGQHAAALRLARRNIMAWMGEIADGGLDAVIVNASGCGTMIKDYGFLFRTAPEAAAAAAIASRGRDICEILSQAGYRPTRPAPGLTIAYHAACSLQHGQGVTEAPKALLRTAGFTVKEPAEPHLCCGSAGTYNLLQPDLAARLKARKLAHLARTGADVIATGNIGCLIQLADGPLPIVHTVELLDWMAGGPKPAAVTAQRRAPADAAASAPS